MKDLNQFKVKLISKVFFLHFPFQLLSDYNVIESIGIIEDFSSFEKTQSFKSLVRAKMRK